MKRFVRILATIILVGFISSCTSDNPILETDTKTLTPTELATIVKKRFFHDRTDVCLAVAVIEGVKTTPTFFCANPSHDRGYNKNTVFEIGSVTKTMQAALLADFVLSKKVTLNDPVINHLPVGFSVPTFAGKAIQLIHLATHTSGLPSLPSDFLPTNPDDPYANFSEVILRNSLRTITLNHEPGTAWNYSNLGAMLLSLSITNIGGESLDTLLQKKLFTPLKMNNATLSIRRSRTEAKGHIPGGKIVPAWNFMTSLAGVGGVRASLQDMIQYAKGQLGQIISPITPALEKTQILVSSAAEHGGPPDMGLGWIIMSLDGHSWIAHEGGTGGFSSFIAINRADQRAVIILADTTFGNFGGLGSLGLHLMDKNQPLETPRLVTTPKKKLLSALQGSYVVDGVNVQLSYKNKQLYFQAAGESKIALGYDSKGDFYPLNIDALLTPKITPKGYTFIWTQDGVAVEAVRITPP
ncbi:MAG: beta-lactamase family protein [Alphaproteobacteria bacterium]|nr:beta-lactamase family protein [Alphaproteobacteria bacterium]